MLVPRWCLSCGSADWCLFLSIVYPAGALTDVCPSVVSILRECLTDVCPSGLSVLREC